MPGIEALYEHELLATFIHSLKLLEVLWYCRVFFPKNGRTIKIRLLTQNIYKSWFLESLIDTHDFGKVLSTLAQHILP